MFRKSAFSFFSIIVILMLAILACQGQADLIKKTADVTRQPLKDTQEGTAQEASPMPTATAMSMQAAMPPAGAPLVMPTVVAPNGQPYIDNFFENYGVNPFIDTEDDHLSTFALDVDTGSYTVVRRIISDGNLPDKDAVRVEEFINYFEQNYDLPPEGKAFGIHIDGGSAPYTESDRYQMLRIGIQGYAVPPEERKDVSLTFVIDVSGSMDMENRLGLVKDALELLVEQLRPSDSVGIVVYGETAHVILEPTSGADKETIMQAINALQPEGSTNAEAGIQLGYKLATQAFKPNQINRVILCSDGVANVGNTSAESIWDSVKNKASEGITLTTVGFGMGNYNDVLMEQLADNSNGFYAYVDNVSEAKRLFVQNLTSTLQVIAMNAKIQVYFNPEVVARYRLVGFENRAIADTDFRNDKVDAGEIGAGHSVTALYEIKLKPEVSGQVATVYLRWEDPDTHEVTEMSKAFSSEEFAQSFSSASPNFQWDVVVAEFAEIMRDSYWAQNSILAGVLEEAKRISKALPEDPQVTEFVEMVRKADQIRK
jgi:Ca-activated chloride channel family protein